VAQLPLLTRDPSRYRRHFSGTQAVLDKFQEMAVAFGTSGLTG